MDTPTNTIVGTLIHVGPIQQPTASFRKRDIVIKTSGQYPQEVKCQVSQDRCETINDYRIGDVVRCAFDLRGRQYTNKLGHADWFTNVEVWRIERIENMARTTNTPFDDVPATAAPAASTTKHKDPFAGTDDDEIPF